MLTISPPGGLEKPPPEDPPILSLTHFSRPPFVTFGCVRLGSACSLSLLLHNPNAEPARVVVLKLPAHRGFSVPETETFISPFESVPLPITWTPLEEGNVRELVTFIVNDVVKLQAVLLGRAEAPAKKKRSVWNNVKKKHNPVGQKVHGLKQKELVKGVNVRTFRGTQKERHGRLERQRSPLQSCENLALPLLRASPLREKRRSAENRVPPTLHISPLGGDLQAFTPGSLRRSKTYSVLCTTEYSESTTTVQTDVHIAEEWMLRDKQDKKSLSPINPLHSQPHNVICTPGIPMGPTMSSSLSPTTFYNLEHVQSGSYVNLSAEDQYSLKESSQRSFTTVSSKTNSSPSMLVTPQRKFLSPNSFVNNSYVPDEYSDAVQHTPILSPDQFVRENCLASQSLSLLKEPGLSLLHQSTSSNASKTSTLSEAQEDIKALHSLSGHVDHEFSQLVDFSDVVSSRLTYCVKKKRHVKLSVEDDSPIIKDHKNNTVLSAANTKIKAGDSKDIIKPQLKSRRRLNNTASEGESISSSSIVPFQDMSLVSFSNHPDSSSDGSSNGTVAKPTELSATVTKMKAEDRKEITTRPQLQSRRKLDNSTSESESIASSGIDAFQDLPIINVSNDESTNGITKKPTVLSATVTKLKAEDQMEVIARSQLKSRRRLDNSASESESIASSSIFAFQDLSIINVSNHPDCANYESTNGIPKKSTVLSATVTKIKAEDRMEMIGRPQLKSRRRLDNSASESGSIDSSSIVVLQDLPVISVPNHPNLADESSNGTTKKPILLSGTVTKIKAEESKNIMTRPQLKSRRRLDNSASGSESSASSSIVTFNRLPVISASNHTNCSTEILSKSTSGAKVAMLCRKRKSEELLGNGEVKGASRDIVLNQSTQAKKTHLSKPLITSVIAHERGRVVTQTLKSASRGVSKSKPILNKSSQSAKSGPPPQQQHSVTFKSSKRVVAVPQSQLLFLKPSKTVIPRHPMPFAAKNMFYDERWMEKQERGFTWWLNFILTPDDFAVKTDSVKVNAAALILGEENTHKVSVPKAPTKEEVSLKAYTARCRLNRLRRAACRLFTSEPVVKAIRRLEVEVEARRLLVRKDRHLWKDIGERQKILNWLLSYNPLWLRVGLETIFGELISLENNSDLTGLAVFILNRLLWNPDIAAEYRHPSVPHLYRDGHEEALSKFTLKKLLLLVFFLDHAKQSRLIDHDPCLFWKDAEFKASKDLLLAFSRDFLSGEGDLSRHMNHLGLPVSHTQTPLDEFDFAVTNLAVDLQCGVRLVRTMELLAQNWSLSKKLRVPAISRLQKMHNVEVAFQVLTGRGIEIKDERGVPITSKDIVDRHRERTLALLWRIAFAFQVDVLLSIEQLKEEIQFLKQSYSTQAKLAALRSLSNSVTARKRESDQFVPENYNERVLLLMEWVNAVCKFYSAKVENFTVSFTDGRVFCYLINHYHPSYLPLNGICQRTTQTIECSETGTTGLNSSSDSDNSLDLWPGVGDLGYSSSALCKELLDNERTNFSLVHAAVSNLGGIPAMIHHSDMSNTIPDEKIVITYLSFLCARLLDLRKEARAARVIQAAWRKYRLKLEERLLEKKHKAACIIQSAVLRFLSRRRVFLRNVFAVVIQKHWRRHLAHKQLLELKAHKLKDIQTRAAVTIQRLWRGYSAQKRFSTLKHHIILMQANVRMKIALTSYKRLLCATLMLQMHLRSWLLSKKQRQKYLQLKFAAVIIQSAFRSWKRKKFKRETAAVLLLQKVYRRWRTRKLTAQKNAAITIQSLYRMHRERQKYLDVRYKIIMIQTWFRCKRDRRAFVIKKRHVLTLQKYYRSYKQGKLERDNYMQLRSAAVCIQAHYRGKKERQLYHRIRGALVIQSFWRMRQQRKNYEHIKQLVVRLQSNVRRYQQQKRFREMRKAACVIQSYYRSYMATKQAVYVYKRICHATAVLQSAFRRVQERRTKLLVKNALKIQSFYRAYVIRKRFLVMKAAVVKIQSLVRMRQQCISYRTLREASLLVQRKFRANKLMHKKQEEYLNIRTACITIQAVVRGHNVRKEIQLWHKAATVLQAEFRMKKQRKQYLEMYKAAVQIQEIYRAHRKRVHQREKFLLMKQSVIRLQAAYRGSRTRKILKIQHAAAVRLQTAFRSYMVKHCYMRMKQSALIIQRWYRCMKNGKMEREHFLKTKKAIVVIQASYRGWVARKQLHLCHSAAVCIQSAFRMFSAQKKLRTMRNAALLIQQYYRAAVLGKRERQGYLQLCMSVRRAQAVWRGRVVRREIQGLHKSATLIQSYYRMHICQMKYKAMKQACECIQSRFRAHKIGKSQRLHYLTMKTAATVLQAAIRGWKIRKQMQDFHKAATIIQASFRSYRLQKQYRTLRTATLAIQRYYRAVTCARLQKEKYLHLKKATITLQSAYRGLKVRCKIAHMHKSAVLIQSQFRMHKMYIQYQAMKQATVTIQLWYRALLLKRKVQEHYLVMRRAACTLQAAWRGKRVRENIKIMHKAAVTIQSQYRMYRQHHYYEKMKKATRLMQLRYRASKERNMQVHQYMAVRNAALCIQSAFRGMKERRELKAKHKAATCIQGAFKCFLERRRFLTLRKAAVLIQQRFRMKMHAKQERQHYLTVQKAVNTIQAAYRGWKARENVRYLHSSATVIQAAFRKHKASTSYQAMRLASIVIQRQYRAYKVAINQKQFYMKQRQSAILIQAAYRGVRERQKLRKKNQAASKIQATFRMHQCRSRYRKCQWAVNLIQQRYRANKLRDFEVLRYSFMKNAAVCIQASFRGWSERRELRRRHVAAIKIQRLFKTFNQRKRYMSIRAATVLVQRQYRASVLTRHHYRAFHSLLQATICVQASYRGYRVRKELEHKHKMATRIQSVYRMHRARVSYCAMQFSASIIQTWYRSVVTCRLTRAEFLKLRKSTILIQAIYRGMMVRKKVQTMHMAATIIQSLYRMHIQQNYYRNILKAARIIQQRYRGKKARDKDLYLYQNTKKATIVFQAAFRGLKVRRHIQKMHQSATTIQRCYKCFRERKRFLDLRSTAICLQRRYRALVVGKTKLREFVSLRKAAVCIQATYRGFKERGKLKQQHRAATKIQSAFRMYKMYMSYQAMKLAATVIQRHYSRYRSMKYERESYLNLRNAAIVVQASYRGKKCRRNVRAMHNAATVIQAVYRMYRQRKYYMALCQATIFIQVQFKANRARDDAVQKYTTMKKSVKCIQCAFRAWKAARVAKRASAALMIQAAWKMHKERRYFVRTKAAAVTIQAAFRGHRIRTLYKEMQSSARTIQAWYRSCRSAHLQRAKYISMRRSAVIIQSAFRRKLARDLAQRERAARKLQSFLLMAACRRRFLRLKAAAIVLQSHYKMLRTMQMYEKQRKAALTLQLYYKSRVQMKLQRVTYLDIQRKIICLQAALRSYCVRRKLRRIEQGAVKIQAFWRGYIQRRTFLKYKMSAVIIQERYRAWHLQKTQRHGYLQLKTAAISLQAVYRGVQARKLVRKERAAIVIQRFYRSYTIRRYYVILTRTVRTLQRRVRAKQQRTRFLEMQRATVCIQSHWRETVLARNIRQLFLRQKSAALTLQSAFRGHVVRKEVLKKQNAACIIQAVYRGFRDRCHFVKLRAAALTLQAHWRARQDGERERICYIHTRTSVIRLQACARGWLVRNKIAKRKRETHLLRFTSALYYNLCAVKIQRCFRAHRVLKRAEEEISNVIYIQRWFRAKLQHRKYLIMLEKVITLQRTTRAWLHRRNEAACKIQRCVRDFLHRRRQAKVMSGIEKFQALWRGYTWRKTHDTKALRALRKRLQKVNQEIKEENKLYKRTLVALDYLLSYKHLSFILAALQHLEVATRLSSVCCENMAKSGAVKSIFTLIRSCNRSIPCMEVIKWSVMVLLNLSKYDRTVQAVYEVENSVDILLDLMQIYREKAGDKVSDKGGSIFTKTCCLLAIFALNTQRAREIRSIPRALARICSIYKLTSRKHKMDAERSICRQLMNTSAGANLSLQATPIRTRVVSRIKPDWVLRKDNMREIVDPLKAICMVMDTLGVSS
ncbi:abnormal spindle-like microcephaly-associated protein [Rhinophrynus dorsalis]